MSFDMDYDMDFVGYEYRINVNINRRIEIFIKQQMHDIFMNTTTFVQKIQNLKFIFRTMENFLENPESTIIITRSANKVFMKILSNIIMKPVVGKYDRNIPNMMKYYYKTEQIKWQEDNTL